MIIKLVQVADDECSVFSVGSSVSRHDLPIKLLWICFVFEQGSATVKYLVKHFIHVRRANGTVSESFGAVASSNDNELLLEDNDQDIEAEDVSVSTLF